MARERAHLGSADLAVEIRREQFLDRRAVHLSVVHGVTSTSTSTLLPAREPRGELWAATSATASSPNSGPTSRTYPASFLRSASRPRVMRDFTVPSEIAKTSAISSYDISSRSRKINAVR